jgi:hypothetical protein
MSLRMALGRKTYQSVVASRNFIEQHNVFKEAEFSKKKSVSTEVVLET